MMPGSNNDSEYDNMSSTDMLVTALKELDEIKRYVANTYTKTDSEVGDILELLRKVERRVDDLDSKLDKIDRLGREFDELRSHLNNIERKIK